MESVTDQMFELTFECYDDYDGESNDVNIIKVISVLNNVALSV